MKKYFLLLMASFTLVSNIGAQDDPADNTDTNWGEEEELSEEDKFKGFAFGINLGVYFASKKTGNFYNGSGAVQLLANPNDVQLYSIAERLSAPPMTNAQRNDLLDQMGGATDFSVPYDSYPADMRYSPAFNIGMQIRYNFNRYAALVMNVNAIRLKAVSQFTLQLYGRGAQVNAVDDIELYTITGTEQRFNFNLGYRQGWMTSDYGNFYMQPFVSMLGTEVQKNQIFIGNNTYDLFLGAANPNQTFNYQPRTDISFGGGLSAGFEVWVKEKYTVDLGFTMAREKVIMITYEDKVWNKWLNFTFTI
jgi:hypothetical protein